MKASSTSSHRQEKKELSTRITEVPGHGRFRVPMHVSRVDTNKIVAGRKQRSWHGWQVRWPGHRRWFGDTAHGGVRQALREAKRYVQEHYPGKRSQCRPDTGVKLVTKKRRDRNVEEFYVEVQHPMRGKACRRLYVGTVNTITQSRIKKKMVEARAIRKKFILEHKAITGYL